MKLKALLRPFQLSCVLLTLLSAEAWAFGIEEVAAKAEALAAEPYRKPDSNLPPALENLSYDQYRDIRFKPDKALWSNSVLPFELQFFHQGLFFRDPVKIHVVGIKGIFEQKFSPEQFDYGANDISAESLEGLGFSGFRVHYPINTPDYKDEVLVFQGASYFRGLGEAQRYGLSARGLAVDTALLSGEEFPRFTEFWIVWPSPGAQHLTLYALLDSERVTGAYRFDLRPGASTVMDVQAQLFLREVVGKLGLAPLTSMFYFGENQPSPREDYRPEVHDSDGLLVHGGDDKWLWRPLSNPRRLLVTSFAVENPKGFGLLQRDRNFDHYQDLESRYDRRPSVWVTPAGEWGKGRVELVQIPTPDETNDNIVAYFVRDVPPRPGQAFELRYQLAWQLRETVAPPTSQVVQSRRGHGFLRGSDNSIRMTVDFEGPALAVLGRDTRLFPALSMSDNGELLERQVFRNDVTGGWRLSFRFRRLDDAKPVEIRALLRHEQTDVSETWSYVLPPS